MKSKRLKFGIVVLAILFNLSLVSSLYSQVPQIINPDSVINPFCSDSVLIAPKIRIQNIEMNETTEGLKISILNFKSNEDTLVYNKIANLNYTWETNGTLIITGEGAAEEYEEAVRKIYYKNLANEPVLENRSFVISLLDADYLPSTKHFYRYVFDEKITWKEAKAAADTMKYYGLQGYLATITSAEENDFIWTKVKGIGWIGASDEEVDGEWKWVTGPEKGQQFWQGSANGSAVNNMFSSWASGEPNNDNGGQQYAHFNQHPDKAPKSWNDLKNDGAGSDPQYYTPQGFVVEFGGMDGDPIVNLSAIIELKINKIAFPKPSNFEICKGDSKQINLAASDLYEYSWSPNKNISNANISNPYVNPDTTITYKVIGKLESCIDSAFLTINVKPVPEINFWVEENAEGCSPLNTVFRNEDLGDIESVWWDFGDDTNSGSKNPSHTYINKGISEQKFDVKFMVVAKNGCQNTLVLQDTIKIYPSPTVEFDFDENKCNPSEGKVFYSGNASLKDSLFWDLSGFEAGEIINDPGYSFGPLEFNHISSPIIKIGMNIISELGCVTDTIYKTWKIKPVLNVVADKTEGCRPLKILFGAPTSTLHDTLDYNWDFGDGGTGSRWELFHTYTVPDAKFDVKVLANSQLTNCSDTVFLPNFITTYPAPNANFEAIPSAILISQPTIQFENKSEGAMHYEWDFNDNTYITNQENPQHEFNKLGYYNVQLSAWNELECIDTAVHQVSVEFDKLYPPNAFSPNASRLEDQEFRIYAEEITNDGYLLQIFNRWGEMIFESKSKYVGWDGTMKNKNFAPAGVYSWVIQYSDILNKTHKQQGTVTLLF